MSERNSKVDAKKILKKTTKIVNGVWTGTVDTTMNISKEVMSKGYQATVDLGRAESRNKAKQVVKDGLRYIKLKTEIPEVKSQTDIFISEIKSVEKKINQYAPNDMIDECRKSIVKCNSIDIDLSDCQMTVDQKQLIESRYDEVKNKTLEIFDKIIKLMEKQQEKET